MASNHANWDEATTKTFLDLCIAKKNQLNWSNKCLTKLGWQHVYRNFKQQTGLSYDSKHMQNKLNTMRRSYMHWRDLQVHTGIGRDKNTGGVAADDTFWATNEEETSASADQASNAKPPPFVEEIHMLFGRTTQDRGTLLSAGGVCEPTLATGSEDTQADMSQDPIGSSSVRNMSKRLTREEVVDSPPKKNSGSLEDYKQLSREEEELDLAMRILEEDDIEEGSDLYCMAIFLCKNAMNRRAFTTMKTKEGRLHWIQFN
uniref:Myb/SANT-like domain-containing protein n=1 Tax=Setaria italica TaxID=4555 RepID=K3YD37_SETIT